MDTRRPGWRDIFHPMVLVVLCAVSAIVMALSNFHGRESSQAGAGGPPPTASAPGAEQGETTGRSAAPPAQAPPR